MRICVFCSANANIDPDFFVMTEELGRWLAGNGHTLVFGGVNQGLMECVGKAAMTAHRADDIKTVRTIGVVPRLVEETGRVSKYDEVVMPCSDLTDRKQIMMDESDAFIALPGGLGTLDEIFSVVAMATIGYHKKPFILYNMKGFWNSLIAMLKDMELRGMVRGHWTDHIKVAESLEDIKHCL